jgi:hypothetical protein
VSQTFSQEIGFPFSGEQYSISQAKLNAKTVLMADANFLQSLQVTYAGQLVRCIGTATNGIFSPNRTYFRNESNTGWIPDTQFKHLHNANSDVAGGLYSDIVKVNVHDIAQFVGYWPNKEMFKKTVTGTSDIINQGDRVDFSTEAVTNGHVIGGLQGGTVRMNAWSSWAINGFATSGSRMTLKIGLGVEQVHLIAPIDRRYGLEACDSVGTSRNYNMYTGDGTTWSIEPTSEAVQQTAPKGFHFIFNPGVNVKMYRNVAGAETFSIKTTHIPSSGEVGSSKPFNIGYKTNEGVAKQYKLYSLVINASPPTTLWPNAFD